MVDVEDAFTKLLRQQATDADRQELYQVRDALGIKPTDAVWLLFIALHYYKKLYEAIPAQVARSVYEATKTARATAEAQARAAQEETKRALMATLQGAAISAAKQAAGAQLWKWITVAATVICLAFVVVTATAYGRGSQSGFATGVNDARSRYESAAAAASWANTPEGRLAYGLARAGSLHDLATCSGRGLVAREGWCVVQPERGRTYRWRLPETATDR